MKKLISSLSLVSVSFLFFSCEKTSISDLSNLAMESDSQNTINKNGLSLGQEFQGGIIFYLDETGKHGLIAAKNDLGPAPWGCYNISIPQARSFDDGYANTQAILAHCNETGTAASLCDAYVERDKVNVFKKYDDWFMPSYYQFNAMMANLKSSGGMCNKTYWVSTEATGSFQNMPVDPAHSAWLRTVSCTVVNPDSYGIFHMPASKFNSAYVRPIRAF